MVVVVVAVEREGLLPLPLLVVLRARRRGVDVDGRRGDDDGDGEGAKLRPGAYVRMRMRARDAARKPPPPVRSSRCISLSRGRAKGGREGGCSALFDPPFEKEGGNARVLMFVVVAVVEAVVITVREDRKSVV